MSPVFGSVISIVLVIIGATLVLIMLHLQGNPKDRPSNKFFRQLHRILGYLFVLLFFVMIFFMLKKVQGIETEFSSRVTIHVVLALVLIPMMIVKILIARFFKRLYPNLITLGLLIFFLSFTMVGITVGYNMWRSTDESMKPVGKTIENRIPKINTLAEGLLQKKCTLCHNLERVKKAKKTRAEWDTTIQRMIKYIKNPAHLSDNEKGVLAEYLTARSR